MNKQQNVEYSYYEDGTIKRAVYTSKTDVDSIVVSLSDATLESFDSDCVSRGKSYAPWLEITEFKKVTESGVKEIKTPIPEPEPKTLREKLYARIQKYRYNKMSKEEKEKWDNEHCTIEYKPWTRTYEKREYLAETPLGPIDAYGFKAHIHDILSSFDKTGNIDHISKHIDTKHYNEEYIKKILISVLKFMKKNGLDDALHNTEAHKAPKVMTPAEAALKNALDRIRS